MDNESPIRWADFGSDSEIAFESEPCRARTRSRRARRSKSFCPAQIQSAERKRSQSTGRWRPKNPHRARSAPLVEKRSAPLNRAKFALPKSHRPATHRMWSIQQILSAQMGMGALQVFKIGMGARAFWWPQGVDRAESGPDLMSLPDALSWAREMLLSRPP